MSVSASKLSARTNPTNCPMCSVFSEASAKIWAVARCLKRLKRKGRPFRPKQFLLHMNRPSTSYLHHMSGSYLHHHFHIYRSVSLAATVLPCYPPRLAGINRPEVIGGTNFFDICSGNEGVHSWRQKRVLSSGKLT